MAALLAAGFIFYLITPKEPSYQGRKLSQWLGTRTRQTNNCFFFPSIDTDPYWQAPRRAVQAMGTNVIPVLLKWGSAKDSKTKAAIISWINAHLPPRYRIWSAAERQYAAYIGFRLLEDKTKPAWPILVRWTYDKEPDYRRLGYESLRDSKADKATILPVFQRMLNETDWELLKMVAIDFRDLYPKEAAAAGVYQLFPEIKLQDQPAAK